MSDPFAKVTPGQRLAALPAEAWNAFIDAAQANRRRLAANPGDAMPALNDGQIIRVKNTTDAELPRFSVLGLDGPIFEPETTAPATLNEIAFAGIKPTAADHAGGRVAILLAPLVAGAIGPAQIDGACLCKIKAGEEVTAATIRMADVEEEQTAHLLPAAGGLQVLWVAETGDADDLRWAIVRLGGGGGDSSQLYKVATVHEDYLVCHTWDPTTETEGEDDVHIAKPWMLQQDLARYAHLTSLTSVDEQTVTVVTEDDAEEEIEAIWKIAPAYAEGDLIQAVARHTGITVEIDEEMKDVTLMDMNHDARAWCEVIPPEEEVPEEEP